VKEQVKSLGATFIEMEMPEDAETKGGYAKEMSPEFIKKEMEAIGGRLPKVDVVITTAQVFGKRAPLLITADMVKMLRPGSVIVDLAAEQGGNCELTRAGETVSHNGVNIIGPVNLPASLAYNASEMYARNLLNFLKPAIEKGELKIDWNDAVFAQSCLTHEGAIQHEPTRKALES
jgi:NAD(P) transhydrogenase subunit alpha